jgi:hypothetical protein
LYCVNKGTAQGVDEGKSSKDAIRALRNFFDAMEEKNISELCSKEGFVFVLLFVCVLR